MLVDDDVEITEQDNFIFNNTLYLISCNTCSFVNSKHPYIQGYVDGKLVFVERKTPIINLPFSSIKRRAEWQIRHSNDTGHMGFSFQEIRPE